MAKLAFITQEGLNNLKKELDQLVNGPPLGLVELAPGVSDENTLSVLVWSAFNRDENLP